MATSTSGAATHSPPPREKPWLLPFNRRLRHLQGITIRSLSLSPNSHRHRGKTIDDHGLPSMLKSPSKALALRETKQLEHSRSSTDLRAREVATSQGNGEMKTAKSPPPRPSATRMRRRSTMEWSGASPEARQKKLEDVTVGRMADTFFTLHVESQAEPIYASEVSHKAMNPSFRFFDLDSCGPSVTRLSALTVKVWAKLESSEEYILLIEYAVELRSLQFIGKTLQSFRQPFPPNSIIFHLTDGVYVSFMDIPPPFAPGVRSADNSKANSDAPTASSSYDALMRLSTLDDCVQDALNTREKLASEIETLLEKHKEPQRLITEVPEVEQNLKSIQNAVSMQRRRLDAAQKHRKALQASIDTRRAAIEKGKATQVQAARDMEQTQKAMEECQQLSAKTTESIVGQRRRICEELAEIYPILPVQGRSLAFTICGIYLPNSEFDIDVKEAEIAAALGFVAKVVYQLALYLAVPLPYPITLRESTSVMEDPISLTTGPRIYPLFMKGTVRYRFEYAVFLLNKDIEIISSRLGLRLLDIRQTLPNLKYVLFVASAGTGDLPARKAGGVRGLMRQMSAPRTENEAAARTVVIDGKGHSNAEQKPASTDKMETPKNNVAGKFGVPKS